MTYGHRSYARMIALYNNLDPEKFVPKGTVIKTPALEDLFTDIGLIPKYEKQFTQIFDVIRRYRILLAEYLPIRRAAYSAYEPGQIDLPEHISAEFEELATVVFDTIDEIKEMTAEGGNTPFRMLRQLNKAAGWLGGLGQGYVDGYEYDMDLVEQRFGNALANAVAWSRE
jgi:hypothetical protein